MDSISNNKIYFNLRNKIDAFDIKQLHHVKKKLNKITTQ